MAGEVLLQLLSDGTTVTQRYLG